MEKIATNNHIVVLRKEIKHAKAMVSGNLIRRIKELKAKQDKLEDEAEKKRIESKIERIYSETKLIQKLDSYEVAKKATLTPDKKIWETLLSSDKATPEDRLTCRIIMKNNIQKRLTKFRDEYKDCDEWLEEYFEYRDKKKQMEEAAGIERNRRKKSKSKIGKRDKKTKGAGIPESGSSRVSKTDSAPPRSHSTKKSSIQESNRNDSQIHIDSDLHPSWASKKREKELLKKALQSIV